MMVKSAIIFLRIVDFFWDAYELATGWITKSNSREVVSTATVEQTKPSYLIP